VAYLRVIIQMKYKVEHYNEEFDYFRCRGNSGEDFETINLNLSTAMDFKAYADVEEDNITAKHKILAEQLIGRIIEVDLVVPWISFGDGIRIVEENNNE